MAGMRRKELRTVVDGLVKQGCEVRDNNGTIVIYLPDGVSRITLHTTSSDRMARMAARADVRRGGLHWPLDPLPKAA